MNSAMKEKIAWSVGGAVLLLIMALLIGGICTVTPPSGPLDTAYKINRFTGKVWLIKTYAKQVGTVRVLAARQAEVEPTKDLNSEAESGAVAMQQEQTRNARR
jgi:hypothetical protein